LYSPNRRAAFPNSKTVSEQSERLTVFERFPYYLRRKSITVSDPQRLSPRLEF